MQHLLRKVVRLDIVQETGRAVEGTETQRVDDGALQPLTGAGRRSFG